MGKKTTYLTYTGKPRTVKEDSRDTLLAFFSHKGKGGEGFQQVFRELGAFWWCPLVDGWKALLTPLNLGGICFIYCVYILCYHKALARRFLWQDGPQQMSLVRGLWGASMIKLGFTVALKWPGQCGCNLAIACKRGPPLCVCKWFKAVDCVSGKLLTRNKGEIRMFFISKACGSYCLPEIRFCFSSFYF